MFKHIAEEIPCTEKFLRWLLPRGIVVCLGLVAILIILGYAPRVQTGFVEYKLVTGMKDQKLDVLWIDTDGRAVAVAEDVRNDIRYIDDEQKSDEPLEDKILQKYTDIQYRVSVRLCGTDRVHSFILPRDVFNAIETNSIVKFETERPHTYKIRQVVSGPDYSRLISEPAYPDPNYLRQYMPE